MTESKPSNSVGIREIVRWWPLVIIVTLLAVGAAMWSESRQVVSYTATTRLVIVPLAQWEDTFIGISLVRDAGDATRTAATVAAQLNSRHFAKVAADYLGGDWTPDSVAGAVKVSALESINIIEVRAKSTDADKAEKLADGFAKAMLADRWKTISSELDARIAVVSIPMNLAPDRVLVPATDLNTDSVLLRLQTLKTVRESGADPTVRIESTSPAVQSKQLPIWVILAIATAGGLFVGSLTAGGMAILRRRMNQSTGGSALRPST